MTPLGSGLSTSDAEFFVSTLPSTLHSSLDWARGLPLHPIDVRGGPEGGDPPGLGVGVGRGQRPVKNFGVDRDPETPTRLNWVTGDGCPTRRGPAPPREGGDDDGRPPVTDDAEVARRPGETGPPSPGVAPTAVRGVRRRQTRPPDVEGAHVVGPDDGRTVGAT